MEFKLQEVPNEEDLEKTFNGRHRDLCKDVDSVQDMEAQCYVSDHKSLLPQDPQVDEATNAAGSGAARLRTTLGNRFKHALRFELPSLLFSNQKHNTKPLRPTAYVDGLRGYSALAVLLWHYFLPYYPLLANGYGLTGKESLLQLPILRTPISAGKSSICFVISGFVSSLSPLKSIRAGNHEKLLTSLSGSVLRRWFRLNLPVVVSTFIINILVLFNLFEHRPPWANEGFLQPPHSTLKVQFTEWLRMSAEWVNPFDGWNNFRESPFDSHTWTLNYEFHDSLILYLLLLIVAKFTTRGRLVFYGIMCWYCFYVTAWHQLLFCGGLLVAELNFILDAPVERDSDAPMTATDICNLAVFLLGFTFIGQPQRNLPDTPGWSLLHKLTPRHWQVQLEPANWYLFYPTIGSIMLLYSVTRLRFLQKWLEKPFAQYLAKNSFGIYLVHGAVTQALGYNLNRWIFQQTGIASTDGAWVSDVADKEWTFHFSMLIGSSVVLPAVFWSAELFQRHVDTHVTSFTRFFCDTISKL